jgi:hypothetical protein
MLSCRPSRHRGSRPRCRVSDREANPLGQAGVAPVIEMEPVRRDEAGEGHAVDFIPVLHHGKAAEDSNRHFVGGRGDLFHPAFGWSC